MASDVQTPCQRAELVGVVRPIPDVCTFVTPVFRTPAGETVAHSERDLQINSADGIGILDDEGKHLVAQRFVDLRITEFYPLWIGGEEYAPLASRNLVVQTGDLAIFGFEHAPNCFLIGTAAELARDLREKVIGASDAAATHIGKYTMEAVWRFLEETQRILV